MSKMWNTHQVLMVVGVIGLCCTNVLASHFRGAIIMARPESGGSEYEVRSAHKLSMVRNMPNELYLFISTMRDQICPQPET